MTSELDNDDKTIVKIDALPIKETEKEKGVFASFGSILKRKLKLSDGLATKYSEAKVQKEQSEVRCNVEEALKIAAERDKIIQEEISDFFIMVDENLSEASDDQKLKLKMAKLMETNPELLKQLDTVNSMIEQLGNDKGMRLSFKDEREGVAAVPDDSNLD